jgi:hypothetical protein
MSVGLAGAGCSSDPQRRFGYNGFAGPAVRSLGLESGADDWRG